ncbi:MAG: hypothetical protein LBR24_01755 [Methanobrevibacter sp.]|nr:hypothetical protein [Methanobrevibacter sp.]
MANEGKLYKCNICGSVLEKVYDSPETGESKELEPLEVKTEGEGAPKHVPIIERDGNNVIV